MTSDMRIDLGIAISCIEKGKGIVVKRTVCGAYDKDNNKIRAGEEARQMIGRTPGYGRCAASETGCYL